MATKRQRVTKTYTTDETVERTCDACGKKLSLFQDSVFSLGGDCKIQIAWPKRGHHVCVEVEDLCDVCKQRLADILIKDFGAKQSKEVGWYT